MTNDAPKRVWVEPSYNAFGDRNWIEGFEGCGQEYIRTNHAQAELQAAVAAEREACAEDVWNECYPSTNQGHFSERQLAEADTTEDAIKAIRERANTDALEAVKAEARAEALREAEAVISKLRMQNQDIVSQWNGAIDQASDAILALIPADQEGDQ